MGYISCFYQALWNLGLLLVGPVAKSTACDENNHQCRDPKADQRIQITVGLAGEETIDHFLGSVHAVVYQHDNEQTAPCVVEGPGHDDGDGDGCEGEHAHACEAQAAVLLREARHQEQGQVPEGPQNAKEEGANQGTLQPLHAREREATPAQFFKEWAHKEGKEKVQAHIQHKAQGWSVIEGSWQNNGPKQTEYQDTEAGEQVPREADAPEHNAAQQAANARCPFSDRSQDKRR